MELVTVNETNREQVNSFIKQRWMTLTMIIRGEAINMTEVEGLVLFEDGQITGLITYLVRGSICEITSLDSVKEGRGVGTRLTREALQAAKQRGCGQVVLITTNDNIDALKFYQQLGFDMTRLYHNALQLSRKLKPEIPLLGDHGIPLRHEIELCYSLDGTE